MRLLPRLLLLLLLVLPATVLLQSGPGGEAGEVVAGLGREGDANGSKFKAGGGGDPWVRRPPRRARSGLQGPRGETRAGPLPPTRSAGQGRENSLGGCPPARGLGLGPWPLAPDPRPPLWPELVDPRLEAGSEGQWARLRPERAAAASFLPAASRAAPPPSPRLWVDVSFVSTLGVRLHSFVQTFVF